MMSVANSTGLAASLTPSIISSPTSSPSTRRETLRCTLSSTTIDASTRMPKSIAPIEIRFAEWFVSTIIANANSTAKGIVIAAINVRRRSPSMLSSTSVTRINPVMMMCRTVCVVVSIRLGAVVNRLDLHARRQQVAGIQIVDLLAQMPASAGRELPPFCSSTMPSHDVRILISAPPCPDGVDGPPAPWPHRSAALECLCARRRRYCSYPSSECSRPMPRTFTLWLPSVR